MELSLSFELQTDLFEVADTFNYFLVVFFVFLLEIVHFLLEGIEPFGDLSGSEVDSKDSFLKGTDIRAGLSRILKYNRLKIFEVFLQCCDFVSLTRRRCLHCRWQCLHDRLRNYHRIT